MRTADLFKASLLFLMPLILTACNTSDFGRVKPDLGQIKKVPSSILNIGKSFGSSENKSGADASVDTPLPLKYILGGSLATGNQGTDFLSTIKYALNTDPEIAAKQREIEAKIASVRVAEAQKDFQIGTILYGGIEDVTDTKGLAVAINASRPVFDGGELDSQIASSLFEVEASKMDLAATIDRRANELIQKWLEFEKYQSLQAQIDERLLVLDPLIDQLEKVAEAGIGDVSRVTAARRTVSRLE